VFDGYDALSFDCYGTLIDWETGIAAILAKLGYPVNDAEAERFGSSVPAWPAFPDSHDALVALADRFELIILANVDNASFEGSRKRLDVDFDHIITAQDGGTYKPAQRNFRSTDPVRAA
jgi:2-haloacid dehalogenase